MAKKQKKVRAKQAPEAEVQVPVPEHEARLAKLLEMGRRSSPPEDGADDPSSPLPPAPASHSNARTKVHKGQPRNQPLRLVERKKKFCELLRQIRSVSHAAEAIGYSRRMVYHWRQQDPEFRQAWDEAWEFVVDELEMSLMSRAVEGYSRPIYQTGRLVGYEQVHHPQLGIFMMKGNRRDKYGDKVQVGIGPEDFAKRAKELLQEQDAEARQAMVGDKK